MTEFCPDCDREFAADYPSWQFRDDTCGMSPAWNAHGQRHDDCINECLLASRNRYRDIATAQHETLARVERQCAEALARMRAEKAALRLGVAAWRALDKLLGVVSEEGGTVVFRVLDDGSRHCQARLVPGRGDEARRALLDCCRKLQLIPAEPDAESREGRER